MTDEYKKFYANYMSLHDSLSEAKDWVPKAEWNDIRCYVEYKYLESANAEIAALKANRDAYAEAMAIAMKEGIFPNKEITKEKIFNVLKISPTQANESQTEET